MGSPKCDKLLLFLENPVRVVVTAKTGFCCGATELLNFWLSPDSKNHAVKIRKYEIFVSRLSAKFIPAR